MDLFFGLLAIFFLSFLLSFFLITFLTIFLISIFYFKNFILFYFILFYFIFFFLSFFLFFNPFYSEPCGGQALGAPARHQGCASEVGEPSSHWCTRDLPAPCSIKRQKSPRDLHLNTKTQFHSITSKLQCWTPYAKQLARQEHSPIH